MKLLGSDLAGASALSAWLLCSGCASLLISGGSIANSDYVGRGTIIAEYNAYSFLTEGRRFLLLETADGLVFVEREKNGRETAAKTRWQQGGADHFAVWMGPLAGKGGAAEYVVPFDRTKPAKVIYYSRGEYTILKSSGITRPVENREGAASQVTLVPRVEQDLRIGRSNHAILSREAVKYLFVIESSDYAADTNVLIIEEPHFDEGGQWNLYEGLGIFLAENPSLLPKTIFLSEGLPRGSIVSVEELRDTTPAGPEDDFLRKVFRSFLIPGYIGLEWKLGYNIPIVGTENEKLYREGARLWVIEETADPGRLADWKRSVVARNKSIAEVLIEKIREYGNPILFVGGLHLHDDISERRDLGLRDYLKANRIGYTFLVAQDGGLAKEALAQSHDRYLALFEAQENNDYDEYIGWLLRQDVLPWRQGVAGLRSGTTVQPSAAGAAKYIRALKDANRPERRERNLKISLLWQDWLTNKEKWRKVAEKYDSDEPPGHTSVWEVWENGNTGERLGVHERKPRTRIDHPHPFDLEDPEEAERLNSARCKDCDEEEEEKGDICKRLRDECYDNPWQPPWNQEFGPRKNCADCYTICKREGLWPYNKCPLPGK